MHLSPATWLALALVLPAVALVPEAEAWTWTMVCHPDPARVCEFVSDYVHFYMRCALDGAHDGAFPCIIQLTLNLPIAKVTVCIDDNGTPTVSDDETCTMTDALEAPLDVLP